MLDLKQEDLFKNHVKKYDYGNWNHTKKLVKLVKELGKKTQGINVAIKTAYIYSIGLKNIINPKTKITKKVLIEENQKLEQFAKKLLVELNTSNKEIKQIIKLIKTVNHHNPKTNIEKIFADAIQLSKLEITYIHKNYQPSDWQEIVNLWKKEIPIKIKTIAGRSKYHALIDKLADDIDEEFRFTPQGLIWYSNDFLEAYKIIQNKKPKITQGYQVKYMLICHSIELSLKAILRIEGYSKKQITDFSHDLTNIILELEKEKIFVMDSKSKNYINGINKYHTKRLFSYPLRGSKSLPDLESLEKLANNLILEGIEKSKRKNHYILLNSDIEKNKKIRN